MRSTAIHPKTTAGNPRPEKVGVARSNFARFKRFRFIILETENATKPPLVAYSPVTAIPLHLMISALSSQEPLIQWLSAGDRAYADVLRQCRLMPTDNALTIHCPHLSILREVEEKPHYLAIGADRLGYSAISLICPGIKPIIVETKTVIKHIKDYATIQIPELSLLIPGNNPDDATSIVRMSDHKGLWCSAANEQHSRAKPNDWTGEKMDKYHRPDELQRFCTALDTHRYISEFQYRAFAFTGQDIELTVTAFLGNYQGDLCRLVQVIDSQLL